MTEGAMGIRSTAKRKQHCTFCKNHGLCTPKKGHQCPYANCQCLLCKLTKKAQVAMRHQQRVWRHQKPRLKNLTLDKETLNGSEKNKKSKNQACDKCRNHNILEPKRNHDCPYGNCDCEYCSLTFKRREIMKHQQRVRRSRITSHVDTEVPRKEEEEEEEEVEPVEKSEEHDVVVDIDVNQPDLCDSEDITNDGSKSDLSPMQNVGVEENIMETVPIYDLSMRSLSVEEEYHRLQQKYQMIGKIDHPDLPMKEGESNDEYQLVGKSSPDHQLVGKSSQDHYLVEKSSHDHQLVGKSSQDHYMVDKSNHERIMIEKSSYKHLKIEKSSHEYQIVEKSDYFEHQMAGDSDHEHLLDRKSHDYEHNDISEVVSTSPPPLLHIGLSESTKHDGAMLSHRSESPQYPFDLSQRDVIQNKSDSYHEGVRFLHKNTNLESRQMSALMLLQNDNATASSVQGLSFATPSHLQQRMAAFNMSLDQSGHSAKYSSQYDEYSFRNETRYMSSSVIGSSIRNIPPSSAFFLHQQQQHPIHRPPSENLARPIPLPISHVDYPRPKTSPQSIWNQMLTPLNLGLHQQHYQRSRIFELDNNTENIPKLTSRNIFPPS